MPFFAPCSDLGVHLDGYIAVVAGTMVVGASKENPVTGRKADAIMAAYNAAEVALRMIRPGGSSKDITAAIQAVTEDFDCKPVRGWRSAAPLLYAGDSPGGKCTRSPTGFRCQRPFLPSPLARATLTRAASPSPRTAANTHPHFVPSNRAAHTRGASQIEGMLTHQITRNCIDGEKQIIQNPAEAHRKEHKECTFEVNEVYGIDVIATTGEGKSRLSELRTTVFKRTDVK